MNPDTENFDSLRKLLALKSHEIPPPGYFDRLPRDIMARIKTGDTGEELGAELSWFRRLLSVFDVKPVFAGAFGTAVCAFLISGVVSSERTPAFAAGAVTPIDPKLASLPPGTLPVDEQSVSSSNAIPPGSLFDHSPLQQTVLANDRYYLPNGN